MSSHEADRPATAADLARLDLEYHEIIGGVIIEKAHASFEHGVVHGRVGGAVSGYRERPGDREQMGGWRMGMSVEIELEPHEVYLPDVAGWRIERMPERISGLQKNRNRRGMSLGRDVPQPPSSGDWLPKDDRLRFSEMSLRTNGCRLVLIELSEK